MATILETERLRLRTWEDADRRPYADACNTPAVTRWLGGVQSQAEHDLGIDRMRAQQARHGHCFWVVERREDEALLGFCGLKRAEDPGLAIDGEVEIGWRLREDAWGRGYAREAAVASLAWGWRHLDAARIVAITVDGNRASWGLMERLGMERRPDLDFDHPAFPPGHELRRHLTYVLARPRA